ncbi:MAG: hypothetical protein ACTSWF_03600 [Candidatus Freyarchaeota archaeon]
MTGKLAIVYSDDYQKYYFGPDHLLRPKRLALTVRLMESVGVLSHPNVIVVEPRECGVEELQLVHHPDYIELVRTLSRSGRGYLDCGDTPAFLGMFEVTKKIVGSSLTAAGLIATGQVSHAFIIGLYHATSSRGQAFACSMMLPAPFATRGDSQNLEPILRERIGGDKITP